MPTAFLRSIFILGLLVSTASMRAAAESPAQNSVAELLDGIHFRMGVLDPPAPACLLDEDDEEDGAPFSPMSREELLKIREPDDFSRCLEKVAGAVPKSGLVRNALPGWTFARAIELAVAEGLKSSAIAGLADSNPVVMKKGPYPLPAVRDRDPVSLTSHPFCVPQELDHLGGYRGRSKETLAAAARFARHENQLRSEPDPILRNQSLKNFWIRNFACLASSESLGDPDKAVSSKFWSGMRRQGFKKPEKHDGVKFYYDSWQSEAISKLNIGLYQFSPSADGNIRPCIEEWNLRMKEVRVGEDRLGPLRAHPQRSCAVDPEDRNQVLSALSSTSQAFNAFCGVQKVVGTFLVQVNTEKAKSTSELNVIDAKKETLRKPSERCVSPHLRAGSAYNHFGVLQATTSTNLKSFLECAMEKDQVVPPRE